MPRTFLFNSRAVTGGDPGGINIAVFGNTLKITLPDQGAFEEVGAPLQSPPALAAGGTLDDSYFSSEDLRAAIAKLRPSNRVTCDGVLLNQGLPGLPTIAFGSRPTGTIVRLTSAAVLPAPPSPPPVSSPPVPPLPPPPPPLRSIESAIPWPDSSGQIRPTIDNPGRATVTLNFGTVPADAGSKPSNVGFLRIAEVPGTDVLNRIFAVFVNGARVYEDFSNVPGVNFTIGSPSGWAAAGGQFNVQPGDKLEATVSAPDYQPGQNAAFLVDFAVPTRY